ncbi:hypothetical protein BD779DRAFT_695613 [Infundibulicybe gibba]|nr:hypothetical protein BD779DRAFT_695613 [Infundibulicybe gibba]
MSSISVVSPALFTLWALCFTPRVSAGTVCRETFFGNIKCENQYSTSAKIGFAVAIVLVLLFCIGGYLLFRRQRAKRDVAAASLYNVDPGRVHGPTTYNPGYDPNMAPTKGYQVSPQYPGRPWTPPASFASPPNYYNASPLTQPPSAFMGVYPQEKERV